MVPIFEAGVWLGCTVYSRGGTNIRIFSIFECWLTHYIKYTFAFPSIRYMYRISLLLFYTYDIKHTLAYELIL